MYFIFKQSDLSVFSLNIKFADFLPCVLYNIIPLAELSHCITSCFSSNYINILLEFYFLKIIGRLNHIS